MSYLDPVDVNDRFVNETWEKIQGVGSYYSIADGVTKEVFRKVLFQSSLVLRGPSVVLRLETKEDYLEVHPIVLGHSFFRRVKEALKEIAIIRDKRFPGKPICCIIPDGLRGAKYLARIAGMGETRKTLRPLSGIPIPCTVFTWR